MSNKPLRILCIHGYRQNGQLFRERTGAFRKLVKKQAELVFIDAPNRVPPLPGNDAEQCENSSEAEALQERGWWFSKEDDYFSAKDKTECCKGYNESLAKISHAFTEQGPFDGVLGFSQGAALVALMCALQQRDPDGCGFQFKFAIIVAGFRSGSQPHQHLYESQIKLPTLHVFGDTDQVIPRDMSEEVLPYFESPCVLQHTGGHFIPASAAQKKVYIEFLLQQQQASLANC